MLFAHGRPQLIVVAVAIQPVEVVMPQRLPQGDPQLRVVVQSAVDQVVHGHFVPPRGRIRAQLLVLEQRFAVLVRVSRLRGLGVPEEGQRLGVEVFGGLGLADQMVGHGSVQDLLHHGQVLAVVVRLEEGVALEVRTKMNFRVKKCIE